MQRAHEATAATPYRVTDLGILGGTFSVANGINATGQVTGTADTDDGAMHAFLYSGGSLLDLGTLLGGSSRGAGIKPAATSPVRPGRRATAATPSSTAADRSRTWAASAAFSQGHDINGSGSVTGEALTADGSTRAFLYSGSMQNLGTLKAAPASAGASTTAAR